MIDGLSTIFVFVVVVLAFILVLTLVTMGVRSADKITDPELAMETRKLYMAGCVLMGLCAGFTLAMGMYYFAEDTDQEVGKAIFDQTKVIIPPIITLVLGYYFGSAKHQLKQKQKQ